VARAVANVLSVFSISRPTIANFYSLMGFQGAVGEQLPHVAGVAQR